MPWKSRESTAIFVAVAFGLAVACLSAQQRTQAAAAAGAKEGQPEKKPPAKPAPLGKTPKAAKPSPDALTPSFSEGPYLLLDLSADANDNFEKPIGKAPLEAGKVPFRLPQEAKDHLSLRQAQWIGWEKDLPWSHEVPRSTQPHDPLMPILRVPPADYVAAHVLAVADDAPGLSPAFTLRVGRIPTNGNQQYVQFDFAGQAPRRGGDGYRSGPRPRPIPGRCRRMRGRNPSLRRP